MVVSSISGIRGVANQDLTPDAVAAYAESFAALTRAGEVLVGRDTRSSGDMFRRAVCGALVAAGVRAVDYGIISTPALFRESRLTNAPAVMVSASHNEPEWNGIKLIVGGRGITQQDLDHVLSPRGAKERAVAPGRVVERRTSSYNTEVAERAGRGTAEGVSVAIDMNGGAAIAHAPAILEAVGAKVKVMGGSPGIFSRTIDPTNDDLRTLCETVRGEGLDAGFAFDCDGDRLVLVDGEGEKRTGDFMLALALKKMLPSLENRSVVVSVDTSMAVDDVVSQLGGTLYRTRVGEANVVSTMLEKGATLGGEGSSGGLIDGSYNWCRDSMIAVTVIAGALKKGGSRVFREVPSYKQVRMKFPMDRRKAASAIRRLQKESPGADFMDGVRVQESRRAWVLVRASGTEDAVRISAESTSAEEAQELAESYAQRVKKLA